MFFRYFLIISPWRRMGPLNLTNLNPHNPRMICAKFRFDLVKWFLRRRFLKFVNVFLLFHYYLPLKKGVALHLNKLESPSTKGALCQVWLKLSRWFLRRRWTCEKFTDGRTDGRTDDGRQAIRKVHLSFHHRWAKNTMVWFSCIKEHLFKVLNITCFFYLPCVLSAERLYTAINNFFRMHLNMKVYLFLYQINNRI